MTAQPLPADLGPEGAERPPRFAAGGPPLDEAVLNRLAGACAKVDSGDAARVRAGRDWWPLSVHWAVDEGGPTNPGLPSVVVTPSDTSEVSSVLRICNDSRVPVVPFAGRSGVCGGSVPVFGGVSLDLTGLAGITGVDDLSLLVDVRAGTFGDEFEAALRDEHRLTAGHWPQSIALSTVGGWVACRGAGQYSTRYGKVEDIVAGLEVVLANGSVVHTGGKAPRAATGPDLTQVFVGSEGTLGVVTEVRLKAHPAPPHEGRSVWGFTGFEEGLEACRRILRRGATPAVLRLYDPAESARNFEVADLAVLVVVDEGDPAVVGASMAVADEEAAGLGAAPLDDAIAGRWLAHRNNLPPIESLARAGIVADTVEISGSWRALPGIYRAATDALRSIPTTMAASAHQSHAYTDGGCLYFTFAGRPEGGIGDRERYYRSAFDAVTRATESGGGAISHHHGVGLNRGLYMEEHLGAAFGVLRSIKSALDPNGILNPGKLGLPSPFGEPWRGS